MSTEILRDAKTEVQPNFEKKIDSYEALIAALHQFLDRLVDEPRDDEDLDPVKIFIGGNSDE